MTYKLDTILFVNYYPGNAQYIENEKSSEREKRTNTYNDGDRNMNYLLVMQLTH